MDHVTEDLCFLTGFEGLLDAQLPDINDRCPFYKVNCKSKAIHFL